LPTLPASRLGAGNGEVVGAAMPEDVIERLIGEGVDAGQVVTAHE